MQIRAVGEVAGETGDAQLASATRGCQPPE
jgi:hypothetical protein